MTRLAKVSFDSRTNKWIATFGGKVLASSSNQKYVIDSINAGRCKRAVELGVDGVEPTDAIVATNKANANQTAQVIQNDKFDINQRFSFVTDLVNMIGGKAIPSMIVTGEGGLGKTFTIIKSLSVMGKKDTRDFLVNMENEDNEAVWSKTGDYTVIKGFSTAKGLYRTLFENKNKIVLFDDCDSVLKDPVALNLLKGALDSFDERWISWNAEPLGGDDLPRSFKFTGQVIFISNMPLMKIDQAIRSRSICVDLTMTADQKIERMEFISTQDDFLPGYSAECKQDAIDFLKKHGKSAKELSLRTLISVVKIRDSKTTNWENLAEYVISM